MEMYTLDAYMYLFLWAVSYYFMKDLDARTIGLRRRFICLQSVYWLSDHERGAIVPERANRQLVCYYTCSMYTKSELVGSVHNPDSELATCNKFCMQVR